MARACCGAHSRSRRWAETAGANDEVEGSNGRASRGRCTEGSADGEAAVRRWTRGVNGEKSRRRESARNALAGRLRRNCKALHGNRIHRNSGW